MAQDTKGYFKKSFFELQFWKRIFCSFCSKIDVHQMQNIYSLHKENNPKSENKPTSKITIISGEKPWKIRYIFRIAQSIYGLTYLWLYNYLNIQLDENLFSFISIDQYIWQLPCHFLDFSHACLVTQANFVIQAEGIYKYDWNGIPATQGSFVITIIGTCKWNVGLVLCFSFM